MSRVSKADAERNRRTVVHETSRMLRRRGIEGTSVSDLMAAAGLTQGGFYKKFESKDALVAEATTHAFDELQVLLAGFSDEAPTHDEAKRALIDYYLSAQHRDDFEDGCPSTGLGGDLARTAPDSSARAPYARGVEEFAAWMAEGDRASGGSVTDESLAEVSALVGALLLSRATAGTPLSERILQAARARIASPEGHEFGA